MLDRDITSWIASCQSGVTPATRSDRHIDMFDARFREPDSWVEGGTACFAAAVRAVAEGGEPCVLALEYFLKPGNCPFQGEITSLADLSGRLSHTPPLIAFYRLGAEPNWGASSFQRLDDIAWPFAGSSGRIYLQEWRDEEDEDFDRRFWLVATPP
jgi:hypothetical protein